MKAITMKVTRCGGAGWYEDGTRDFKRVSRWIKVKQNYNPCPRNGLWDFVNDENGYKPYQEQFNPANGLHLDYFRHNGRNYAIEQFYSLGNPFYMPVTYQYRDENEKDCFLSGVDMYGDLYHPIYIEMDDCGEYVRVYEEV